MGHGNLRQAGIYRRILSKVERGYKCMLCCSDFSVSHGGFNDVTRHVNGIIHVEKLKEAQSSPSIMNF